MTSSVPSPVSVDSQLLRTGRADSLARFERTLYQLVLTDEQGEEETLDLGFSGSRLLERLLRTPGEVVSREELMSYAWEDRVVGQGSLNQQIYTLRHALLDSGSQIIQTLPRRGYLFNPHYLLHADSLASSVATPAVGAAEQTAQSAEVAIAAQSMPLPVPASRSAWLTPLLSGTGMLLLLALATLGYRFSASPSGDTFTHSMGVGALQVTYIDKNQTLLDRLVGETRQLIEHIARSSAAPGRLIVNMSPGFYEIRCLHGDGRINWLKVHKSQLNAIPNEHLMGCLK
jgi:DNA-binding winged helix-turn-helix (wHTH) protein